MTFLQAQLLQSLDKSISVEADSDYHTLHGARGGGDEPSWAAGVD